MWEAGFAHLVAWVDEHGTIPTQGAVAADGHQLGGWVAKQRMRRTRYRDPRLSWTARLEAVPGWTWAPRFELDGWGTTCSVLEEYAAEFGHARVLDGTTYKGVNLGSWVDYQRREFNRGRLSIERADRLMNIPGWVWSSHDARFETMVEALRTYAVREGHFEGPRTHRRGRPWARGVARPGPRLARLRGSCPFTDKPCSKSPLAGHGVRCQSRGGGISGHPGWACADVLLAPLLKALDGRCESNMTTIADETSPNQSLAAEPGQMRVRKRNGTLEAGRREQDRPGEPALCRGSRWRRPDDDRGPHDRRRLRRRTTSELDELSIRTAAAHIVEEPNYSKLAARILSNVIDKEVRNQDIHSFSQSVRSGTRPGSSPTRPRPSSRRTSASSTTRSTKPRQPFRVLRPAHGLRPLSPPAPRRADSSSSHRSTSSSASRAGLPTPRTRRSSSTR